MIISKHQYIRKGLGKCESIWKTQNGDNSHQSYWERSDPCGYGFIII